MPNRLLAKEQFALTACLLVIAKVLGVRTVFGVRQAFSDQFTKRGFKLTSKSLTSVALRAALVTIWRRELYSIFKTAFVPRKMKGAGWGDGELGLLDTLRTGVLRSTAQALSLCGPQGAAVPTLPTWKAPEPLSIPESEMDWLLERLDAKKNEWKATSLSERVALLRQCIANLVDIELDIADAAVAAKGSYETGRGEERLCMTAAVGMMREVCEALEAGGAPRGFKAYQRPDGQHVARVFPETLWEEVLFSGWRGEVWIQPGKAPSQGRVYKDKASGRACGKEGTQGVNCLLAAGNQYNLTFCDIVHQLFLDDNVVLCKMNPLMSWLTPFVKRALAPLLERGFLEVVDGGVPEARYLTRSEVMTSVHMTGARSTFDAVVWQGRPKQGPPPVQKFVGGELGGVTPFLICPGEWTQGDIEYQARNVVAGLVHNASHNCLAAQLLLTARGWPQRRQFLDAVRAQMRQAQPRASSYPATAQRYREFLAAYPEAETCTAAAPAGTFPWLLAEDALGEGASRHAVLEECWCGALAEVALDCAGPADFLAQAVRFANQQVDGNLSCALFISPETQKRHPSEFEAAVAGLRFGSVAVNCPTLLLFAITKLPWGAYPGNTVHDIGSGNVATHNTKLFDFPEKGVLYAPWRYYPAPFWFHTHPTLDALAAEAIPLFATGSTAALCRALVPAMRAGIDEG